MRSQANETKGNGSFKVNLFQEEAALYILNFS